MAPKRKTKGSKGSKSSGTIIDGVSISEMSREQLEPFVMRIQTELEREREERNYFQIESDKIKTFWEITRQQLEECKAKIKNRDKEIEELEDKHRQEIKLYHQKVKHLMYEQHIQLSSIKVENMVVIKNVEDDHKSQEIELLNDKCELKSQIRELQEIHLDQLRTINLEYTKKLKEIQTEYENNCRILETKYQTEMEKLRDELDLKNSVQQLELEERKNNYIAILIENHDKAFNDMKNYYKQITDDNLKTISTLKEELQEIKQSKRDMEKQISHLKVQNRALEKPLKSAQQTVEELKEEISIYKRDERIMKVSQKQINEALRKYNGMQHLYNSLLLSYDKVRKDKEIFENKTTEYLVDMQQKINLANLTMEKKVLDLNVVIKNKNIQINNLLSGQSASGNVDMQVTAMETKNNESDFNNELSAIIKKHNDIVRNYKLRVKGEQSVKH